LFSRDDLLIRFGCRDHVRKRIVLASIAAIIVLGTATFAFLERTACALIEYAGLESLPAGIEQLPE
jgi:uracil-DNA glycosylase